MKKILIIGLGLIGSSIALGIKKAHPEFEILGSDREEVENIAQKRVDRRREASIHGGNH